MAGANPEIAGDIAGAMMDAAPEAAQGIAQGIAAAAPDQAADVAGAMAEANPEFVLQAIDRWFFHRRYRWWSEVGITTLSRKSDRLDSVL